MKNAYLHSSVQRSGIAGADPTSARNAKADLEQIKMWIHLIDMNPQRKSYKILQLMMFIDFFYCDFSSVPRPMQ